MNGITAPLAALALLALAPSEASAQAQTLWHSAIYTGGGAAVCQPALPVFAGTFRARPLALQNEGDASAFLTCTLVADGNADPRSVSLAQVLLLNNAATAASVTCTIVSTFVETTYRTRTVSVPAGGRAALSWNEAADGAISPYSGISCNMPRGTGIGRVSANQRIPSAG